MKPRYMDWKQSQAHDRGYSDGWHFGFFWGALGGAIGTLLLLPVISHYM